MDNKIAIIISSFDGYKDLWKPLEESYKKFWNDCPFTCYLVTNFEVKESDTFTYLPVGKDNSWSDMMIKALNQIDEDYILLTFDDLFFYKTISSDNIKKYIKYALDNNINYFQLHSSISKNKKIAENIVKKEKNSKYRNATVWSLWKKEVLLDLLDRNENAWEFEDKGSIRSNKYDKFYMVNKPVIPYINGVVKGKWVPSAVKILKKHNIEVDTIQRDVMSFKEFTVFKIKDILYDIYKYLLLFGKR